MLFDKNNTLYFTTSWDDGSVLDLKLAEILDKYRVKGTFYIPKNFEEKGGKFSEYQRRLTEEEIRMISLTQELGAHSLGHRSLDTLSKNEIKNEVQGSKLFLEKIIGKEIEMFCFPKGVYNNEVLDIVKSSGYLGARTIERPSFLLPGDGFLLPVSVQCAPFPFRKKDARDYYWGKIFDPIRGYGFRLLFSPLLLSLYSWQSFARSFLNYAIKNGNYFHLFGHSWELEKYKMWGELESFIEYARKIKNANFISNSEIIHITKELK